MIYINDQPVITGFLFAILLVSLFLNFLAITIIVKAAKKEIELTWTNKEKRIESKKFFDSAWRRDYGLAEILVACALGLYGLLSGNNTFPVSGALFGIGLLSYLSKDWAS